MVSACPVVQAGRCFMGMFSTGSAHSLTRQAAASNACMHAFEQPHQATQPKLITHWSQSG